MEEKDDVVKNAFYAKLNGLYDKYPVYDTKILRRSGGKVFLAQLSDCSASR